VPRRLLLLLSLVGCSTGRSCGPDDPRFQAAVLAEPLRQLKEDPGSYGPALQRLEERMEVGSATAFVEAIHSLRVHVTPAQRSDDVCTSEVVGQHVIDRLQALQSSLLAEGSTLTPVRATVCRFTPLSVPLPAPVGRVLPIRFLGWDLDRAPLQLEWIDPEGQRTPIDGALRRRGPFVVEADWGGPKLAPPASPADLVLSTEGRELARLKVTPHAAPVEMTLTQVESAPAQHPKVDALAPADHVVLGGGCLANWVKDGQLLTASHPTREGWHCASKDHTTPEVGTVRAFVLSTPKSSGLVVHTASSAGVLAHHSQARAELPPEFKLIGGGCAVDFGQGAGSLLVNGFPDGHGFRCDAKDHVDSSPGVVTAWAIGLLLPEGWRVVRKDVSSTLDHHPQTGAFLPMDGTVLVGGGCRTDYSASGSMLWASHPNLGANGWLCAGKDHRITDRATLTATALGLRQGSTP
jgi:hypothetical protein